MADNRRYNKNINSALLEYHVLEDPTTSQKESAYASYTWVPLVEEIEYLINSGGTPYDIIKITSSYHYSLLNTNEPAGQTWIEGTNQFTTLYDSGTGDPISTYMNPDVLKPSYLKVGTVDNGFKYYEKKSGTVYYELCGKMPSNLKNGEIAVNRGAGYERLFIKNSNGEMVEFRDYKSQVDYVNLELEEVYNLIYSIHYVPSWSVSPNVIFKGTNSSETATARLSFNGSALTDFGASTPSGWTVGTTTGETRTFTKTVNSTSNVSVVTTISKDAYSKAMSATITTVNHIFYGQDSSDSKLTLNGLTSFGNAVTSSTGRSYTVTMTSGNYFYVAVPASVTRPTQVGVGGASGFFENLTAVGTASLTDTVNNVTETYYFFRTPSTQTSGTFNYYLK